MMRVAVLLFAIVCSGPLLAFDLPERVRRVNLFAGQDAQLAESTEVGNADYGGRQLPSWNSRGFGMSLVATGALLFPAAGIGLEFALPVHPVVSLTFEAGLIGGIFYEGSQYQFGARGYLDLGDKFAFTLEAGIKLGYGRPLDFVGGTVRDPETSWSVVGFCNPGFEVGGKVARFFVEITINGADTLETHYEVEFFCGFNFGLRVYIGA